MTFPPRQCTSPQLHPCHRLFDQDGHPPYSPDLGPCDFWLFPKLRGCHYETTEEMKEVVTKVIDTLVQEDFHGAFQMLLEQYNKCIALGGDYFEKSLETYLMILVVLSRIQTCVTVSIQRNCLCDCSSFGYIQSKKRAYICFTKSFLMMYWYVCCEHSL